MITDRRNNRLIEIAPDKRIVWEFPSPSLKVYRGSEDVNISADGKFITADFRNCRNVIINPKTNKVETQWGTPGKCKHKSTARTGPPERCHPHGEWRLAGH